MTATDTTRQTYRDTLAQLRAGIRAEILIRAAARLADRYRAAGHPQHAPAVTLSTRRAVADVLRRRIEQ